LESFPIYKNPPLKSKGFSKGGRFLKGHIFLINIMALETAVLKPFIESNRDASKFHNITPVTSLVQITEGSNVLHYQGKLSSGQDYLWSFEQIRLDTPKIPIDIGLGPMLSVGEGTPYTVWTYDSQTGELLKISDGDKVNFCIHAYFFRSDIEKGHLYFINENKDS